MATCMIVCMHTKPCKYAMKKITLLFGGSFVCVPPFTTHQSFDNWHLIAAACTGGSHKAAAHLNESLPCVLVHFSSVCWTWLLSIRRHWTADSKISAINSDFWPTHGFKWSNCAYRTAHRPCWCRGYLRFYHISNRLQLQRLATPRKAIARRKEVVDAEQMCHWHRKGCRQ